MDLKKRAAELAGCYREVANGLLTDPGNAFALFATSAIDVAILLEHYCAIVDLVTTPRSDGDKPDSIVPFDASDAGEPEFSGMAIWKRATHGVLDWGALKFLTSFVATPDEGIISVVKVRRPTGSVVLDGTVSREVTEMFNVRDQLEGLKLCPVFGGRSPLIWESSEPVHVTASFQLRAK